MKADELRELLKSIEPDIAALSSFWELSKSEEKFAELGAQTQDEHFWQNKNNVEISRAYEHLKESRNSYKSIVNQYAETSEMLTLFGDDEEEMGNLIRETKRLIKNIGKFKRFLLLQGENDDKACFVSINAGAGGTESQDWASMLLRMYLRFCERENFTVEVLDYQSGEEAGIKSATLRVVAPYAYGLLRSEMGVHRLVRISPFDSNQRRHTSFASVSLLPELADAKIEILDKDLRIDTYRAGGAGGQHVNKTDSAVRITHLPTNIVVQCQNERSQMQNRQVAMKMLMAKLVQRQEEEKKAAEMSVEKQKIEWGSQIRSYVLHPYKMVKDLRTDHESPQPDIVLDGDIMPFIESYLLWQASVEK